MLQMLVRCRQQQAITKCSKDLHRPYISPSCCMLLETSKCTG